jgi:8-oxo-dGTP diphosphatase
MKDRSLNFRVVKAILALPVTVCVLIPAILLYLSGWQWDDGCLWRLMVGAICLLAGLTLAIWTIRLFQNKGKGTLAPWDATRHLITSGPYAYVRNPMITGIFLILTGEACLLGSYAIGIWTVLFLVINLIYFPLSEEPGLRARFGKEYDTYCQNVPRYIPRLTPWKRIEVVAAIIHDDEGRIFATQRGYGDYKDGWEFPGGKMEAGETPEEALKREIWEELETRIVVERLVQTVEYDYPQFHLTMHCFWCHVESGSLTLKEHEAARWLSREQLDSVDWLPADLEVVEEVRSKI